MKGLIRSFLEYIRPSFWEGDYNFLWIYLALIVFLIIAYERINSYFYRKSLLDPVRTQQNRESMQKAWARQQEQIEALKKEAKPDSLEESKSNPEAPQAPQDPSPSKAPTNPTIVPQKAKKTPENPEKPEENSEESEKLERARKKSEYFSGSSGAGGYRPNVKDRYPGVYKRGG